MPVVVYIKVRKDDHFSVLRGISGNTVWLADPSLGNRTYSRAQFLEKTEGSVAPLVAIGVMTASRFIVQRWVTQRVAQAMITRGATNVWAPCRAIASRIAGRNGIREFHVGSGARYTHFHPNPRNGSHVWYGSPR
jgi:peptidase C39, bacteriocin processing